MKPSAVKGGSLLLAAVFLTISCQTPPAPPEASEAERLERALWGAGASIFALPEYREFQNALKRVRQRLSQENAKFGWFRDYDPVRNEFQEIIQGANALLKKILDEKSSRAKSLAGRREALGKYIDRLKGMTDSFNENGTVRQNLLRAEIASAEARLLLDKEDFEKAASVLEDVEARVREAEAAIGALLNRYLDPVQIAKWRRLAQAAVAESKTQGIVVIVVSKLERKMSIYKNGLLAGQFEIGLGRHGLSDKLYAGDEATPEGRYRIVKKYPDGPFYKALLIDYPNEEDKNAFALAKKQGSVPRQALIGGAIEIHGGGKDSLTKGCVGLENKDMDLVYEAVEVGTPVTIVGTLSVANTILADIKKSKTDD